MRIRRGIPVTDSCEWIRKVFSALYPNNAICMGCGSLAGFDGEWLCDACRKRMRTLFGGGFYDEHLDGSAAAYRYKGPVSGMVQNFKYRGVTELTGVMAEDMMKALKQIQPVGAEVVVPVPMHADRLRRRGYNQSELLARRIADELGVPCELALVRIRNTAQQARLDEGQRRRNLKNAFLALPEVSGWRVLLVDDVYTTGETARECARALKKAGAISVSFLAYARGR